MANLVIKLITFTILKTLSYHTDIVLFIAFSPDSRFFGTASQDKTSIIYDMEVQEVVKIYR